MVVYQRSGAHPLPLNDYQTATVKVKNLRSCSAEETKSPTSWMPWGWMMATAEHLCIVLTLCVCACTCLSDYYSLLGVSRSASSREIKKAFHRLALKHHPDKNQSPNAQQIFTRIAQAYEVLSDREKRRVYDQIDHLTNPDQAREGKFKKVEKEDPFVDEGTFHSKRGFQHFSLKELLHSLRMDDDFFMGEQPGYEGWSFIFGPEDDDDETVLLSDLFNML